DACLSTEGVYCSRCVYYGKHQSFQATAGFRDYAPNAYSSSNGWSVFYRNRRRLKANQTGKKFRVGIKSNISTNRNNLISGVDRCIHLNAMKKTTITSINRQTIKI